MAPLNQQFLLSTSAAAKPYIECNKLHNSNAASNFINIVAHDQISHNLNSKEILFSAIYAYEFINQDADIVRRRVSERSSLRKLRKELFDTTQNLVSKIGKIQTEYAEWEEDARANATKTKQEFENTLSSNLQEQKEVFDNSLNSWNDKFSDLENTYEENLRLSKPAVYWKKSAARYAKHGYVWCFMLTVSLILGLFLFHDFFVTWLQGEEIPIGLQSVQGLILFGTVATVYAFFVRVLSRLVFSSFHLMRDAEEREQLAYLYLALSNEGNVDEKSRQIVLQALFSRSETGLLAGDHGPTMPGFIDGLSRSSSG